MDIYWLLKVTIISVVFPLQANFSQPQNYEDAWGMLDEAVDVMVEQAEEPSNEEIEEMAPITQSSKSDKKNNKPLLSKT
jgi:hypothetical protein